MKRRKPARLKLVRYSNGNVGIYLGSLYDSQHYGKADLADRIRHLVAAGHAPPKTSLKVRETRRFGVLIRKRA